MRITLIVAASLAFGLVGKAMADGSFLLRVSTPLVVSGAAAYRFGPADGLYHPSLLAEAGVGGGKVAVGLDNHGAGSFGFALRGALLRTWIEPISVDEDQDFLGLEGEMSFKRLVFNIGGYRRVSSGPDDWLGVGGLGVRF